MRCVRSFWLRPCAIAATLILAFAPVSTRAAALSASSRVGPAGVGALVFGMTPAQAAATGTRFAASAPSAGSSCYYLRPVTPRGIAFMVEHGTLRRAEIVSPEIRTTEGFRVGDPLSKIVSFYRKRARLAPDKYDRSAQTVTIDANATAGVKFRMVFEIEKGSVRKIFAGARPQIDYVEGCG